MKTLGLIGGTSWLSTVDYYKTINQQINERLGGLNSAKLFLYSINFEEFKPPADPNAWAPLAASLINIAQKLITAGAGCIVLCANTPHMVADLIQKEIRVPLIHIAEATANAIAAQKISKVGLLGTKLTMEQPFFRDKLTQQGIDILTPPEDERAFIHASIFDELGKNIFKKETKEKYLVIINKLIQQGAQGIIFGCTELPLLIPSEECSVPVFDTLLIHATAAVDFALKED
jgi:aspartate racemase